MTRNLSMGGNLNVQGGATIGHNLKVKGRLEADNVYNPNKGVFFSSSDLNAAYPKPEIGWYAGVKSGTSVTVYAVRDGAWASTGYTMTLAVNLTIDDILDIDDFNTETRNILASQAQEIAELKTIVEALDVEVDIEKVEITVQSDDINMGSAAGGGTFAKGSTIKLTATAKAGYQFKEWKDNKKSDNPRMVEATADATYIAVFEAVAKHTVTVGVLPVGGGSVSGEGIEEGSGEFAEGSMCTLRAEAGNGYAFTNWTNANGDVLSTEEEYTFKVMGDAEITANFTALGEFDYYIGWSNDTDDDNFAALTDEEITTGTVGYYKSMNPTFEGSFGGSKKVLYILYKSGSAPVQARLLGSTTTTFSAEDIQDPDKWWFVHDAVEIDGVSYSVVGYGADELGSTYSMEVDFVSQQ